MKCRHGVKYANAKENDLMILFYGCDDDAFTELWECRLQEWLRKIVASEVRNREDVEDVMSEVAIKLVETKRRPTARFDPQKGDLRPWVARIVKNEITNHFRRQNWSSSFNELAELEEDDNGEIPEPPDMGPTDEEQAMIVRYAVKRLEEPSRTIILLRFWEDLTQDDISRKLGIPLATVNRRLKHDLRCLKELLKG